MKVYLIAISGFLIWGVFPLYFSLVKHVSPLVIVMYRGLIAACFMLLILKGTGKLNQLNFKNKRIALTNIGCGLLIASNWFIFLLALEYGYVLEISMGYFALPLFNMLIGILFFGEKMRWNLAVAIFFGLLSLAYQALKLEGIPWVAIGLAGSFGAYGILRKTSKGDAQVSFTMEMSTIAPFFLIVLVLMFFRGNPIFGVSNYDIFFLLFGGVITIAPLLTFALASRMIPLAHLGLINYITPSMQFLEGLFFFNQALNKDMLISFILVWIGLSIFSAGQFFYERSTSQVKVS